MTPPSTARRLAATLSLAALAVAAVAAGVGLLWMSPAAADPTPSPTSSDSVTVTIPSSMSTPSAVPSGVPGGSGGGSGSGGGHGGHGGHGGSPSASPSPSPNPTQPGVPASPVTTSNTLVVMPRVAHPRQSVVAVGKGYTRGEKVQFVLYPEATVVGSSVVDPQGVAVLKFDVPAATAIGQHVIEGFGWTSGRVAAGKLDVVPTPVAASAAPPWLIWVITGGGCLLVVGGMGLAWLLGWLPWFSRAGGA